MPILRGQPMQPSFPPPAVGSRPPAAPPQPSPGAVAQGTLARSPAGAPPLKADASQAARVRYLDVAGASALVLLGAFAAFNLPEGPLRMALALSVLLFAPGYLLLQALVVPAARGTALLWQALASIGLSPAIVGLLALSTSIVQGGFRLGAIVILVTLGSLSFGACAVVRRRSLARAVTRPSGSPKTLAKPLGAPRPSSVPEAARAKSGPTRP